MRKISIDEYKQIIVQILQKIDRICRENNLSYALASGTLLGAIRHNGFIPWDDDADIVMFRSDYIRLREIINNGDYGIRFVDITTDSNTIYPFGKVCDTRTYLKEKNFRRINNYGAYVDVFPLDFLPTDESKRKKLLRKYRKKIIMIVHSARTGYEKAKSPITNVKRFFAYEVGHLMNTSKMVAKMNKELLEMDKQETDYVGIAWGGSLFFERSYFEDLIEHEFEGYSFFVPKEYDSILRAIYGDYMKLPPENERIDRHLLECYIIE